MQAEDLSADEGGEGQVVKQVGEVLPHIGIAVLAQALIIEPVNLSDLPALMFAPSHRGHQFSGSRLTIFSYIAIRKYNV